MVSPEQATRPLWRGIFEVLLYIDGYGVIQLRQICPPLLQDVLAWVLTRQMSCERKKK